MTSSFHLLLGSRDWRGPLAGEGADLVWDERGKQVKLRPELLRFPASSSEEPYEIEHRRGAAADRFGHIYWIGDDERSVHYQPAGSHEGGLFWSVEELERQQHGRACCCMKNRRRAQKVTQRGY